MRKERRFSRPTTWARHAVQAKRAALLALLILSLLNILITIDVPQAVGQNVEKSADVIFEIQIAAFKQSPLFANIELKGLVEVDGENPSSLSDLLENDLSSIAGAIQLPKLEASEDSANLLLVCRFKDPESAEQFLKVLGESTSHPPITISDATFLHLSDIGFYGSLYVGAKKPKSIVIGTESYLRQPKINKLPTANALDSWKALPRGSFRLAADFEPLRKASYSALFAALLGERAESEELITTCKLVKHLGIVLDLDDELLAAGKIASADSESQPRLQSGMDGLLFALRVGIRKALSETGFANPEIDAFFFAVAEQLRTSRANDAVEINVSRPANTQTALQELNAILRKSIDELRSNSQE